MTDSKIDVFDTGIRIINVEVPNKGVADHLRAVPEAERERAVIQAVEVGIFCLERARAGQDLDFVKREIDNLLNSVQRAVEKIPEDTQKQLAAKIGTGEGQVLAPVQSLVNEASNVASQRIQEIRDLLQSDIDPAKETSTLGKALHALRDLLDPKRTDSIQGSLDAAVRQVTADGGPLANAVETVVKATLKPLEDRVNDLAKEVRGQEAAAEALEQTTQKGASYEDEVVRVLQAWAQRTGAEVNHVGMDNRPGDVLVVIDGSRLGSIALRIVIEARDRQTSIGRMAISETLDTAMSERTASSAVYVSKTLDGLALEIGEWAEGSAQGGRWIACSHEHLITAIRFLVVQERLQAVRAATPTVDASSIQTQVQRIQTSLGRIRTISSKVTDVRGSAEEIQKEAEAIRGEIRSALSDIEEALRVAGGTAPQQIRSATA